MLGIIYAMDIEAQGLMNVMDKAYKVTCLNYEFTRGLIEGKPVVIVKSGIGKCNAAAVTALLISRFGVNEVINLGVCGGFTPGAMIVADSVVQYDFDTTAFGDELGQLDGFDSPYIKCTLSSKIEGEIRGVIASGDKFVASKKETDFLVKQFGAVGFDMESGAVAQICTKAGVNFAVVRVVSDGGDADEYEKFKAIAADKGVQAVCEYIKKAK